MKNYVIKFFLWSSILTLYDKDFRIDQEISTTCNYIAKLIKPQKHNVKFINTLKITSRLDIKSSLIVELK